MERQLKERLIGAAVLVAAAVIMVPEMFSGAHESTPIDDAARPAANQLKTYRVELNSSPATAVTMPVEPPAERPLNEAVATQANTQNAATPATDEPKPQVAMNEVVKQDAAPVPAVKPEVVKPEAVKPEVMKPAAPVAETRPSSGGWAVQVGSFSAQDKAQQIAGQLNGQGLTAFVAPVQVSGKTLYRVRVGGLRDRPGAEAALQKLRASYPGASVVAPGR